MDVIRVGISLGLVANVIALCHMLFEQEENERRGYHAYPYFEYEDILADTARFRNATNFDIETFETEIVVPCMPSLLRTRSVEYGRNRRYELSPGFCS